MKPLFRILIIASTLIIPFIFSPQSHAELRSPCALTDSEQAMIAKLTRMRNDSHFDRAKIKECLTFASHTVLIRYEDGYVEIFGIGEGIALDQKQEASKDEVNLNPPDETINPHTGNEHERQIFTELDQIWHSVDLPDDLSPEQLVHADALVKKLFATTPADEIQLATYNSLGFRGNRYLAMIKELSSLSPGVEIIFYEGYLDRQASDMRTEDIPTDSEKQAVIRELIHSLETKQNNTPYLFSPAVSKEIQGLDSAAYEILIQRGVINENTFPQTASP